MNRAFPYSYTGAGADAPAPNVQAPHVAAAPARGVSRPFVFALGAVLGAVGLVALQSSMRQAEVDQRETERLRREEEREEREFERLAASERFR